MDFEKVRKAVKAVFKNKVTYMTQQHISLEVEGTGFAICENGDHFNIYQLSSDGSFLPGCKQGKSVVAVRNFINARI